MKSFTIVLSWLIGLGLLIYGIAQVTSWLAYPILGGIVLLAYGGYKPLGRIFLYGVSIFWGDSK